MKEKILAKALLLFNSLRIDHVTIEMISRELGISKGNLTYHFAKKDDIVFALYRNMITEQAASTEGMDTTNFSLREYVNACKSGFEIHLKYRFIILNYYSVVSSNPKISKHHKDSSKMFDSVLPIVGNNMMAQGLLKNHLTEENINVLNRQIHLMGIFWLQEAELLYPKYSDSDKKNLYVKIAMSPFLPYLTAKGKLEFTNLVG